MSEALAITDDADLFSDPDFTRAIQERTRNRAKAFFHGRGFDRLLEIADSEDDKTALSAITTIGKLAGEFKAPRPVTLSFDELIKRATAVPAGPLSDITQIREAQAIDAEEEEDDG
jgi:hypothetical protein